MKNCNSKHFSFFSPKKPLKINPLGAGGVPQFLFHPKSYFFCDLKPHAKFQNPMINPSGRKVTQREREREIVINSGHLVPPTQRRSAQLNEKI